MVSESFSHYRVIRQLGAGGMGEVYLAEDMRLGRQVALKFLPASFQYDEERRARFLKEARAASALRSPNIAAVYDIGEHEGSQFIAMEYVEGDLLSRRVERGPLSVGAAVDIAAQVADALDEAHSQGIIHRDIKSSNLIVTVRGLVKVLDFGLAKLTDNFSPTAGDPEQTIVFGMETTPGIILGTVAYMSPEQARGLAVDARSDIFSLGVVLYEMLAGRRPFAGATASDLIVAILEKEPPPLAAASAEMPAQLEWIVAKALRKKRDERYQSAKDLLVDLRNLKQSLELEAARLRTTSLNPDTGEIPASKDTGESSGASFSRGPRRRSRKAIDSIAVLPLANASADPEMEYLSDGITEGIINSLSRLPKLRVMARSTVFRYRGENGESLTADAQAVGRELGVRSVMTGRVRKIGENILIGTELVDVEDGSQLWGEQYNRRLTDIFALQEEISGEISERLRLKLGGKHKRPAKQHTESAEAYELYLKGRYYWNRWTEEGLRKSVEFFERALEKDPNFALAHSGLSDAYGALWYFNYAPAEQTLDKAKAAATRALELDDTLAEAHLSLADIKFFHEWDWAAAEREFKRAIELNPSYANARHMYALYLISQGKPDEALQHLQQARELDPLSLVLNLGVGHALYYTGKYEEAIKQFKKTLELDPTTPWAYEGLGLSYEALAMYDEAVAEYMKMFTQLTGGLEIVAPLREAYARSGIKGYWRKCLEFSERMPNRKYVSPYLLAGIYAIIGEKDRAFEYLERACDERAGFVVHINIDRRFESLRSDPRFADLVRRIGLKQKA